MQWRPIPEYGGYEASESGELRHTKTLIIIPGWIETNGYVRTTLTVEGRRKKVYIHQLVATSFLGPAPSLKHEVAHGDGCRLNNAAINLRWATRAENLADRLVHGTHARGDRCTSARLTWNDVGSIRARAATESQSSLAKEFGVNPSQISRIVTGARNTWKATA